MSFRWWEGSRDPKSSVKPERKVMEFSNRDRHGDMRDSLVEHAVTL